MGLPPEVIAYQLAHKDDNIGYQLISTSVIFGILALMCVTGRLCSRYMSPGTFGTDDALVVVAMVFGIMLVITASLLGTVGLGRHLITIKPDELITFGKINLALQTAYPFTIGFARLSILALYHRLFAKISTFFRYAIWVCVVYNILFIIGVFLVVYLQCQPLHTIWTASCAPKAKVTLSTSILNIVGDVLVLVLPQPLLWSLKLPWQRKLGISVILCMGIFTVAISIARIFIITRGGNAGAMDITYTAVNTFIFTVVEPMTAIMCSCLPVMQPVFRLIFSRVRGVSVLFSRTADTSKTQSQTNLTDSSSRYIRLDDMKSQRQGQSQVKSWRSNFGTASMNDEGILVSKQFTVDSRDGI